MRNPFDHPAWIDISFFLGRASLGVYFLLSGWGKMTGPGLSAFANGDFLKLKPAWLPEAVALPYGYALPVLELVFGLALALGLLSRIAAGGVFLMLVSFTIVLMTKHGVTGGEDKVPFHPNVVLAALALILMVVGPGRLALDPLYAAPSGPVPKGK